MTETTEKNSRLLYLLASPLHAFGNILEGCPVLDKPNEFLLHAARKGSMFRTKLALATGAKVGAEHYRERNSPLHWAAKNGDPDLVKLFISNSADVNARGSYGQRPLHEAVNCNHYDAAKLLINNSADVNAGDRYDNTPLHAAAKENVQGLAQLLISNGANVNARNTYGLTPLYEAIEGGHTELARLLVDNGANVNSENRKESPLHWAARYGRNEITKLLIDNGANVNARNEAGETPLQRAKDEGFDGVAKLIQAEIEKRAAQQGNGPSETFGASAPAANAQGATGPSSLTAKRAPISRKTVLAMG